MNRKVKIKILKYNKNLFHIVVALNKQSIKSHIIEKLGVIFFSKESKVIKFSSKRLSFWLNNGAFISNKVSYFCSLIFLYYLKVIKENKIINKYIKKKC